MLTRVLRLLQPSHEHSEFSATVLLMTAISLSRVIGYVREAYIAWAGHKPTRTSPDLRFPIG
jgi:putative peptidoglycan lipid II flippase